MRVVSFTAFAFVVLGPLIGTILVILWAWLPSANWSPPSYQDFMLVGAWAYALGWLPAAGVGFTWGLVSVRLNRSRPLTALLRATAGACLGTTFGVAAGLLWDLAASSPLPTDSPRLVLLCTPCGLIASLVLCMAFPRPNWLRKTL